MDTWIRVQSLTNTADVNVKSFIRDDEHSGCCPDRVSISEHFNGCLFHSVFYLLFGSDPPFPKSTATFRTLFYSRRIYTEKSWEIRVSVQEKESSKIIKKKEVCLRTSGCKENWGSMQPLTWGHFRTRKKRERKIIHHHHTSHRKKTKAEIIVHRF